MVFCFSSFIDGLLCDIPTSCFFVESKCDKIAIIVYLKNNDPMKKTLLLSLLFSFFSLAAFAQRDQTVKGTIIDKESKLSIIGASIILTDDASSAKGTSTDLDGNFRLNNIPVGKHNFLVKALGYQNVVLTNILVTSGKEVVLNIEMEQSVTQMKEIKITATDTKEVRNDMATVSARTFDVQETERYAGSRQDPARMASNFAGVQGTDDSRNDIVVRGNSPLGVVWRLEDIDIFNPNHFSIPGTSGGPLSIINNKTLANSDFFTGAFPAEYGNGTSSVFDLKLRNGNRDKYEGSVQFGILGAEVLAEGPISKKHKSSFLITGRYATLQWLQALKIPVGTSSIPKYQDGTFKLNFPLNKNSRLTFFGIGGMSHIDLIVSKFTTPPANQEEYGEDDRDQYFKSNMGVLGTSYAHTLDANTYTKLTLARQGQMIDAHHTRVYRDSSYNITQMKDILGYNFKTMKTSISWYLNHRFDAQSSVRFGFNADRYTFNMVDSIREFTPDWKHRWDYSGSSSLIQPYAEYKYKFTDDLVFNGGIHVQYFTLNSSYSVEPRLGLKRNLPNGQSLGLGFGVHSQTQPFYTYFYHYPDYTGGQMHNLYMDFTRSRHFILSYDKTFSQYLRMKVETYYQYLYNVPIENRDSSSFSLLNMGSAFERFFPGQLSNDGTGRNYGLEMTLEKFFHRGYYFMLTGSLYDSKARGRDSVLRNTDFNGHFALNALGGIERNIHFATLSLGGKITWGAGKRYSPYNLGASSLAGDGIVWDQYRNAYQFKNYFRADLKVGLRFNAKKVSHEVAIDLVNIMNTKNILGYTYNPDLQRQGLNPVVLKYQLGFLPLFYYKVDF